ncbi:MAG: glycosyltransferase family 9 protein [Desulfovibrionales bacterium]|nr:glycosyltransferase family 9 protein [Desulfovibrionales bacterium]
MRTAILNLTRFGDLLQTQPLISGLCTQGDSPELISLESFQAAAAMLGDLQHTHTFPDKKLSALLNGNWIHALSLLETWLRSVNTTPFDHIINVTPSLAARLLTRCFDAQRISGFGVDAHGFALHSTLWAVFLQAASAYRHCNPFNLVDLFQRMAGQSPSSFVLPKPLDQAQEAARSLLKNFQDHPLVAFQLGASQDFRRWPVDYFVQAGHVLWEKAKACPVLLGTQAETHLAQEFARLARYPYLDLTGKTELPVLATVLSQAKLLLTNDTGTMHLAAGLGIPILAIFLATAQPFDTGPYLEGALSLEPDLPCHPCSFGTQCQHNLACIRHINPGLVGTLAVNILLQKKTCLAHDQGIRLWQAQRDEHGFMDQISVSGHEHADRTLWIKTQRAIYRQFLDQNKMFLLPNTFWNPSDFTADLQHEVQQYLLLLTLIEEQGRLLAMRPYPSLKQKFLLNCQNLQDILSQSTHFGVLGLMWRYLSNEHSHSMHNFVDHCLAFRQLLLHFQKSLPLA